MNQKLDLEKETKSSNLPVLVVGGCGTGGIYIGVLSRVIIGGDAI